ncbi:hypothetical protein BWD14_06870 [Leptospira santarosai]|uniref:Uncharacterized protein n=1 Tax=Leptospira santarosai TaxID=28183 RepID=A0AB73M5C1_9LEPT|nr:hypothetical protein BWD14_06870 [Leptospira santarosai]
MECGTPPTEIEPRKKSNDPYLWELLHFVIGDLTIVIPPRIFKQAFRQNGAPLPGLKTRTPMREFNNNKMCPKIIKPKET